MSSTVVLPLTAAAPVEFLAATPAAMLSAGFPEVGLVNASAWFLAAMPCSIPVAEPAVGAATGRGVSATTAPMATARARMAAMPSARYALGLDWARVGVDVACMTGSPSNRSGGVSADLGR